MTPEQKDTLATIVNRFEVQRQAAKNAADAISNAKFKIFTSELGSVKSELLERAANILYEIAGNSSVSDAVKYFNNLEKLQ